MNLDEYKNKLEEMDELEILHENDRIVNEIYRLQDSLAVNRKKYSSIFARGRRDFKKLEKGVLGTLNELRQKTNVLVKVTYSKR